MTERTDHAATLATACSLVMLAALATGCDVAAPPSSDGGLVDAVMSSSDAGPAPTSDLGESCAVGCNAEYLSCAIVTSQCDDVCLLDAYGDSLEAYCSQACDPTVPCPSGYSCYPVDNTSGFFCFADPVFCGDGIVGRGEECDAGPSNGEPGTMCSTECEAIVVSYGEARFTMD